MSGKGILRLEALAARFIGVLLGLVLIGMVVVNVANAAGRYSGLFALVGADELLVYGMIWIVMLGAVLAARDRSHLAINLLPTAVSGRLAATLQIGIGLVTVAVSAFVAWHSFDFVERIAGLDQTSMGLGIPMVLPHSAVLVGFGGIAAVTAMLTILDIARLAALIPQLQSGGIDGMLAGMPILTAFKFYDTATNVTDINMSHIVSVTVVNEAWFQSQPDEVKAAIVQAGRAAEETVFGWGVANVQRANKAWVDNGGNIHTLPADQQAELQETFARVGNEVIDGQPDVIEVRDRILSRLKEVRGE